MKNIIKTTFILLISFGNIIYSQITVNISNVFLNNQTTVTNCGTLDFGTTQNNSLVFTYSLSRPQSNPSGTGKIRIMLRNTFGNSQMITEVNILDSFWSGTSYNAQIIGNISASQVEVSGFSAFLEFETSSGIKSSSCLYSITKALTPSFSLTPTTVSLSCGDTSQRTFTVNASNIPSGANVTYNWNHPNWTFVSGSGNSRTLQPSSSTFLPSNVTVTPFINGVAQTPRSCVVSRAPMPSISINGNSTGCVGNTITYTISGNTTNANINWSISNTTIANFVGTPSNTSTTIQIFQNGQFDLNAFASNSCGQSTQATRNIWIGNPPHISGLGYIINAPNLVNTDAIVTFSTNAPLVLGATGYEWHLPGLYETTSIFPHSSPNWHKLIDYSSSSHITVYTGTAKIAGLIQVGYKNDCGVGSYITKYIAHSTPGGNNGGTVPGGNVRSSSILFDDIQNLSEFVLYPNPASKSFNILPIDKYNTVLSLEGNIFVDVYDNLGRIVISNYDLVRNDGKISIENLKSGLYLVNILDINKNLLKSDKLIVQ